MKTVEEQMVVMQAFVDGKTIKRTSKSTGYDSKFKKCNNPKNFNWTDFDYDIVEEPIVKYMLVTQSGSTISDYTSYEAAKAKFDYFHCEGRKIIKVVQDMDFNGEKNEYL